MEEEGLELRISLWMVMCGWCSVDSGLRWRIASVCNLCVCGAMRIDVRVCRWCVAGWIESALIVVVASARVVVSVCSIPSCVPCMWSSRIGEARRLILGLI